MGGIREIKRSHRIQKKKKTCWEDGQKLFALTENNL